MSSGGIGVAGVVGTIIREISIVASVLAGPGRKRLLRPLMISTCTLLTAYFGVYLPPQRKSQRIGLEIQKAKVTFGASARYEDLRDQLAVAYKALPAHTEREQWLANSVKDSLDAGGLITDIFRPTQENEQGDLLQQTTNVTLRLRFSEFYDWLLRLESARPMMFLLNATLTKKKDDPGYNSATVDIGTVIPRKRYN